MANSSFDISLLTCRRERSNEKTPPTFPLVVNVIPVWVVEAYPSALKRRLALDAQFRFRDDGEPFFFYFHSAVQTVAIHARQNPPERPLNSPDITEGMAFCLLATLSQNPEFLLFSPIQMSDFYTQIFAQHFGLQIKEKRYSSYHI